MAAIPSSGNPFVRRTGPYHPASANGWHGLIPPSPFKFGRRYLAPPKPVVHELVINERPQPWQKRAARLAKRDRLGWNDRRVEREARKREQRRVAEIAQTWGADQ